MRTFRGFADVYPEAIVGTNQWFYGQSTPCTEASEVLDFAGEYAGTRLYLFHISGEVLEPIPQEKNVFLERPIYSNVRRSLGIIRYDFNQHVIQILEYLTASRKLSVLGEIPMSNAGDLINVRIIKEPFMLVKHDVHGDAVDFLWPTERKFQFEENEALDFVDGDVLVTARWMENPAYHEEVIKRDYRTGAVLERKLGCLVEMPNGERWLMTE